MRSRVIGAVLGFVFGVAVVLGVRIANGPFVSHTVAADTHSIHLTAAQTTSRTDVKSGDQCGIVQKGEVPGFVRQVVVKNEADVVIGKKTLYGSTYQSIDGSPLYCALTFSIDVPDSSFYTVFIDDIRVTTWTASELPTADKPVVLTLSGD